MAEITETKYSNSRHVGVSPEIHYRIDSPDQVIEQASQAFKNQHNRKRTLDLVNLGAAGSEGIYLLPKWSPLRCELLKVDQRRGIQDLLPRGSSAHGISFGIAQYRTVSGIQTDIVAIKPFDKSAKAMTEARINATALERGFDTTDPICVIADRGKGFIVTKGREGVMPLDTEPWHQFSSSSQRVKEHFVNRLYHVGDILARLHSKGIRHGDPQLKNFWVTPLGAVEPFDWESGQIYSNPPDPETLEQTAAKDLGILYRSLTGDFTESQIFAFKGPHDVRVSQFREYVLVPYINSLFENLATSNDVMTDDLLAVVASLELSFSAAN